MREASDLASRDPGLPGAGAEAPGPPAGQDAESLPAAWLDAEGLSPAVVCQVYDDCCLQMSPSAYWLYDQIRRGRTPGQIAVHARERFGAQLEPASVAAACEQLLRKVEAEIESARARRRRRYAFRIRLLPEAAVARIASRLEFLFRPAFAVAYAVLLCAAVLVQASSRAPFGFVGRAGSGTGFLLAYGIYLLALCAHEFGHASACSRYGMRPGDIGFAVYLVFPAVYCDVTRAWLLPRRQRVVVDIAGVLFETGAGALFAVAGGVFHMWFFTLAALLVLGNLIWILNPFGRFDLYWTLADALGVIDLRREGWRALGGVFRRTNLAKQEVKRWRKTVVLLYAVGSVFMLIWFGYYLVEIGIPISYHLPGILHAAAHQLAAAHIRSAWKEAFGPLLAITLFIAMIYRMAGPLVSRVRKFVRRAGEGGEV
jgi:putative peptide zinc metalloprotease protein